MHYIYFIANFSAGAYFTPDIEYGILVLPKTDIDIPVCVTFKSADCVIEEDKMFTISLNVDNEKVKLSTAQVDITVQKSGGNVHWWKVYCTYLCNNI